MIVLDTSVIYALLDAADNRHLQALEWYDALSEELITTPLVLAEADHLALTRGGRRAAHAFRVDVASGGYLVEWWPTAAREAAELADRYADLEIGLTDASLVVLASRVNSADIATFDERHFRAIRPLGGATAFRLLPLDASTLPGSL
ncbi:MAG: type II toxin-antitoxin system VapC family toxin [Candidatus Limnocylindria bacterium]